MQSVLDGSLDSFELEYACPAPGQPRWFVGGAVVLHTDVTAHKKAELRLHEALSEVRALKERFGVENGYL